MPLTSSRNRNRNRENRKPHQVPNPNPLVFSTKTEKQILKSGKYSNCSEHQKRKTEVFWHKDRKIKLKNGQNRKTENPNAPLPPPPPPYVKILIISLFTTLYKLHSSPCCFPYLLLVPWLTFLVTPQPRFTQDLSVSMLLS